MCLLQIWVADGHVVGFLYPFKPVARLLPPLEIIIFFESQDDRILRMVMVTWPDYIHAKVPVESPDNFVDASEPVLKILNADTAPSKPFARLINKRKKPLFPEGRKENL